MAIETGSSNSFGQRPRVASPGWAAFDRLQRNKLGIESETDVDPYPPITSINDQQPKSIAERSLRMKAFSSVVQTDSTTRGSASLNDCRKTNNHYVLEVDSASPVKMLKRLHKWANEDLIRDILVAVNNDQCQAFSVLKAMSCPDNDEDEEYRKIITASQDHLNANKTNHIDECVSQSNKEIVDTMPEALTSRHLVPAPVEPEWEEDDVYLTHRRDAIKMMRTASKHSRAASNAFLRGDRVSAHQLSVKAREEREAAEKLNREAAMEILSIRNAANDIWKLDLHGLHASEAVNILKGRLHQIESMRVSVDSTYSNKSVFPSESAKLKNINAPTDKHLLACQPRRNVLQVITGTGNHSRGEAALPSTVRGFLIENGYCFDDARPGVLAVRPKFRRK